MQNNPFIHRFTTGDKYYFYDVNTNRIVEIDEVTWQVLGSGVAWTDVRGLRRSLPQISKSELKEARRTCKLIVKRYGALSSFRPTDMANVSTLKAHSYSFLMNNTGGEQELTMVILSPSGLL